MHGNISLVDTIACVEVWRLGQNDVLVCLSSEGVGMGMPHQ